MKKLLRQLYPKADRRRLYMLHGLAKEKNAPEREEDIDNIFASIIRHTETHYASLLEKGVKRQSARAIVAPKVNKMIKYFKGF